MTVLAFLLDLAGFVLLGLANDRQHRALFGTRVARGSAIGLRAAGWSALGGAAGAAFVGQGVVLGGVVAFALLMAGAGVAFLLLHLMAESL